MSVLLLLEATVATDRFLVAMAWMTLGGSSNKYK
jgi:hypothetical protein